MADSIAIARVQKELKDFQKKGGDLVGIRLDLGDGSDMMKFVGEIDGPPDTVYSGGHYKLLIEIPPNYPFSPPKIRFTTPIWHPNISSVTGAICLDILSSKWAAAMTLRTVLLSIQALLESPEPDDPQDAVVAAQFNKNRACWEATAKFWAQYHANAPGQLNAAYKDSFDKVVAMGFDSQKVLASLSQHNWNTDNALQFLFN